MLWGRFGFVVCRRNAAASWFRCFFSFTGWPRTPERTRELSVTRSSSVEISCFDPCFSIANRIDAGSLPVIRQCLSASATRSVITGCPFVTASWMAYSNAIPVSPSLSLRRRPSIFSGTRCRSPSNDERYSAPIECSTPATIGRVTAIRAATTSATDAAWRSSLISIASCSTCAATGTATLAAVPAVGCEGLSRAASAARPVAALAPAPRESRS